MAVSGVCPVFENVFKIGTSGKSSTSEQMKTIADLETFSVSLDNGIEEWNPMDMKGWKRRLMTAKALGITLNGKRNVGDDGNDYVAGLAFKTGQDAETKFEWTMPDGTKIEMNVIANVTNIFGGDSTNVGALEVEVLSNGKPTVTEPTSSDLGG